MTKGRGVGTRCEQRKQESVFPTGRATRCTFAWKALQVHQARAFSARGRSRTPGPYERRRADSEEGVERTRGELTLDDSRPIDFNAAAWGMTAVMEHWANIQFMRPRYKFSAYIDRTFLEKMQYD